MDNDYKRRGRPRKYPTDSSPSLEDKPREECSYQEFFPDLNIKEPLPITRILEPTPTTTEQDTTQDLIMEEGDALIEEKIKKLPIVSYKKIQSKPVTITTTNQIFHRPENHYIRYIGIKNKSYYKKKSHLNDFFV